MIFLKGDWPYYFPEYLSSFSLPEIWSSVWPTGLGGNQAIILPLKLYLQGVVFLFVNKLGIPWEIIQIIFFFGLFIALSIYSSYKFTKSWIGSLIYTSNTWILPSIFIALRGGNVASIVDTSSGRSFSVLLTLVIASQIVNDCGRLKKTDFYDEN